MIVGFCSVLANPFGPLQFQLTPAVEVVASRLISEPVQTGELLPAVGVTGVGFTVAFTVPAAEVHPLMVTVTV